ncbi:VWA domain-containing protein [Nonomuraea sp. MG754425]|uniref:vWA domain-containing protein n=1 Tax=Nonomuraea sp. MG754425 TaxID=2570319 RepID=UPI001F38D153|nr:vWA domain-containing protein [Nonomuraea sp. MG754425]MCF6475028.1 VWA domain-containing protein [Nonomuraea sp. MG754425]
MDIPPLLSHFRTHDVPLELRRGRGSVWDDAELHRSAQQRDPEGYALLALVPGVLAWQRARVLLATLAAAQDGLDEATRATLGKAVRALMFGLPPAHAVTALLALRRLRANHKHTTRAIVAFVLEHPEADALIEARRPALADCFEHALGKATARACARLAAEGDTGSAYLRRSLLRFTADPAAAIARLRALYGPGTYGAPAPREPPAPLDPITEHPPVVTPTNRGDIAATLVHLYRGGPAAELLPALRGYVARATRGLPRLAANVAVVLDASGSMRGYGDREWAVMSQAVALRLVLAEVCERLTVVETGGTARAPAGSADLAVALLDALGTGPDLVVVVTDGYENHLPGDLARVVATLPRAGAGTPVVLCQATFTRGDDLTLRDPAPELPRRPFWHQDDFAGLLPWVFAHCRPGRAWLRTTMLARLEGART